MKRARCASGLFGLVALILSAGPVVAQNYPEVRRAQPADEPPVARALPVDQPPVPRPRDSHASPAEIPRERDSEAAPAETESPDRRQLDYANALFLRKLYDLAVPEYQKYLDEYPGAPGGASAYFFLGECHRALNRPGAARKSFQKVLDDYGESEFAGPAAYVLAETAFTEKDYAAALPLFHRAAAKSKESAVALSARYFEARCLETLDRKDEACGIYQQVSDAKNPNPYREDSRLAAASILSARGKKTDALKQYEALANETQKPALKAEAAPIYADLRASQLSPKLRAESAYKLGLCCVQLRNISGIVEAFTYYVQAFPDSPPAPAALAQRALAYEQDKNYGAALSDLNTILTKYPGAHEREAALQLKALILGQQENAKGMAETFRQLLKEFPRSSVGAQAQYYIGKAAFEAKDYKTALAALDAARQLNKEQYYNLATLRIISSYFGLKDRSALTKEVNDFMATSPTVSVPAEILEWLGIEYYNEKNYEVAEKYLSALGKIDHPANMKPDFLFYLGDTASKLKNFAGAEDAFGKYLQLATDPAGKAKVLLALGAVKIGAHKPDDAQKIAEEIMTLQPEGRVNAEARLLAGDVQSERGNFYDAGKAFMSVALLYDDPAITPRALEKAALAYQRAGKTDEADRLARQLRERYPNYAGG